MKVAIVELCSENHHGFVGNWVSILQRAGADVTVFTRREFDSFNQVSWSCDIVFSGQDENLGHFLRRIRNRREFDWVIITTLQNHFFEFVVHWPRVKTLLCIHNSRTWFDGTIVSAKGFVRQTLRWFIRSRTSAFAVTSRSIRDYVSSLPNSPKVIAVMPFGLYNGFSNPEPRPQLKVVVPGMLSRARKRSDRIMEAAEALPQVNFVFLGHPHHLEEGREELATIRTRGLPNVRTFERFVDSSEFAAEIQDASILLSDIVTQYRNGDYSEVYGRTKDTGISYLQIEYQLPALVNSDFQNLPELASSSLGFKSVSNLIEQLTRLVESPSTLQDLRDSARRNSQEFTIQRIYESEFQDFSW